MTDPFVEETLELLRISEPQHMQARYFRITFPEPGRILLKVGPGDHTVKTYELTRDDLRGLILDGLPELLGG